jgi:hypothetical protein
VDVSEIQAIERFYEKLCHLVERQRVSDPLSLSVVHKVKQLLESGSNMHRALLTAVCEHIQALSQIGGANNPYIMPILHFIRQSVRVSAEDLQHMLRTYGLQALVFQHKASRGTLTASKPLSAKSSVEGEEKKAPKKASVELIVEPDDAGEKSKAPQKLDFE